MYKNMTKALYASVGFSQEQKLALQSRTKENHLNQLAEVEKRFSLLSKQCALVKQAHDKLEQNGNGWLDEVDTDDYWYS